MNNTAVSYQPSAVCKKNQTGFTPVRWSPPTPIKYSGSFNGAGAAGRIDWIFLSQFPDETAKIPPVKCSDEFNGVKICLRQRGNYFLLNRVEISSSKLSIWRNFPALLSNESCWSCLNLFLDRINRIWQIFSQFPDETENAQSAYGGRVFNYLEKTSCTFVFIVLG